MSAVAEGVEDLEALAMLGELGCDYAQGFAVSPPVSAIDLPAACRRAERQARSLPRRAGAAAG
jgi:EAL domain-containing protein (putative c-di-GMP-specific phosphodiesterase class I)